MNTLFLYAATVLIWGSTWFVITLQLGQVPPEVSVAYRFAIAALLLLGWCAIGKKPMRYTLADHAWIAAQGFFLFSANYMVFYRATGLLTSGLVAVVFSTIVGWNLLFGRVFFAQPAGGRVLAGAALGLAGLALVFWPEIQTLHLGDDALSGLMLCVIATVLASFGNMASARNQKSGLPVLQSNAYGMAYGAAFSALYAWVMDLPFTWEPTGDYVWSLLYLALFGSVLAFGAYLTLLGRIGAGRAAYASVLFPVVAITLSMVFEHYTLTPMALAGATLVVFGNVLVLNRRQRAAPQPAAS